MKYILKYAAAEGGIFLDATRITATMTIIELLTRTPYSGEISLHLPHSWHSRSEPLTIPAERS